MLLVVGVLVSCMDGSELADKMVDSLNSGIDSSEFVETVSREHRYLQGEVFTAVLKPLIVEFARKAKDGEYDARNKRACIECRSIAEEMNWSY